MQDIKKVFYKDLMNIQVIENHERFLSLKNIGLTFGYIAGMKDMEDFFGGEILIRESVAEKLLLANKELKKINKNLSLYVTYGYRSLEIQTKRFLKRLNDVSKEFVENPIDLYEKIHYSVAVPTVAGHPTGGAVDVLIFDQKTNTFLDFGTSIYDHGVGGHETFSKDIPKQAQESRILLNNCMVNAGFAPFWGEYRHFSYGDKEWAFYYDKPNAIYEQIPMDKVKF